MEYREKIVFYLPRGPRSCGDAFPQSPEETVTAFAHQLRIWDDMGTVSPQDMSLDSFHPRNFVDLRTNWFVSRIWLVDRIRGPVPLIHIVDHRNFSGRNPLRGRTPMGEGPRFPDVSRLYVRQDMGLPQRAVTTVGPERFEQAELPYRSETAALVALCAGYAGVEVVGIGWNDESDPRGVFLGRFVEETVKTGRGSSRVMNE